MQDKRNQRFEVSSMGTMHRTSLEMFAHHLEDDEGQKILLDDLAMDQTFFVVFESGTGFTRTSAVRID